MKNTMLMIAALIVFQASFSFAGEDITISEAKRTSRDYGKLTIARTEPNQEGQTKVVFETCFHPGIGKVKTCYAYLYELLPQGLLNKDSRRHFSNSNDSNWTVILPAGTYYGKIDYSQAGKSYYATGEFTVTPFVTNLLTVEIE